MFMKSGRGRNLDASVVIPKFLVDCSKAVDHAAHIAWIAGASELRLDIEVSA
jgi:hypothetical protein